MNDILPGPIALFGSGETSLSGGRIFEELARRIEGPVNAAFLETPAGFELNSAEVVGRVAEFVAARLQNYHPSIHVVAARKRGTLNSPDNPEVIAPLRDANLIFLGPGSPSYAVRQLQDSLAWHTLLARHRRGAALALASAATVAVGSFALPVYEIYKVGEDPHWKPGLDLLRPFGLSLVFIPHWDNTEGGPTLDTSRCFAGAERFEILRAMLPGGTTVMGMDEHTGLILDPGKHSGRVMGRGGLTIIREGTEFRYAAEMSFDLRELGDFHLPEPSEGIPADVWASITNPPARAWPTKPSAEVVALLEERVQARSRREWAIADQLRDQIAALGWVVVDTPQGSRLEPAEKE